METINSGKIAGNGGLIADKWIFYPHLSADETIVCFRHWDTHILGLMGFQYYRDTHNFFSTA